MRKSSAFTLAEVLITLAIIGVVAAMTIPGVIVRTNQQEFNTGFKNALSVLNQAITMNMAMDNESPEDLAAGGMPEYLMRRMNVIQSDITIGSNTAFYTADGFRYEIPGGLADCTADDPCIIAVDVNGDRGPISKDERTKITTGYPTSADTNTIDFLAIMITDTGAQPFGAVAQRTMYQADK